MAETGKELAVAEGRKQEKEFRADQQKPLDTPRTREACRRLGLVPEDLQIRSFDSFHIPGDLKEKHQLRFEHYEKKRKERFSQVLAERAKVIAENAKKGDLPGAQSAQFLSMLESLFEKEAKRMEIDMKGQLRQHSSLVKENEEQIRKEGQLQEKMEQVDKKRELVVQKLDERGKMSRELLEKKIQQNKELQQKLEKEHEDKQANYAKEMMAEEERLQRFLEERKVMGLEKTAVFRERVAQMKEKTELLQEERRMEGEKRLQDIEVRVENVSRRREDEQKQRQLRSEEQHLHLMDVREAKSRIDRVDGYRRQELRDQIHSNVERIETLLALKDQLLDQRKGADSAYLVGRNTKVESTRGSRGLCLRDIQPGPGTYEEWSEVEAPPTCLHELPAARIGKSKVPGLVDSAIQGTRHNPAPGSFGLSHDACYDTILLPKGDKLNQPSGGEFNKRNRDSFLDDCIRLKSDIPAPGRYDLKSVLEKGAVRMARERIVGENLDKHSAKRYPSWARPTTETPGPAGYSVDDYTRKEVLRRAQKSLPNLTRDMLRPGKVG